MQIGFLKTASPGGHEGPSMGPFFYFRQVGHINPNDTMPIPRLDSDFAVLIFFTKLLPFDMVRTSKAGIPPFALRTGLCELGH